MKTKYFVAFILSLILLYATLELVRRFVDRILHGAPDTKHSVMRII